ncbi:MAG: acyltransferase [Deltaproteobacteria bacterium]
MLPKIILRMLDPFLLSLARRMESLAARERIRAAGHSAVIHPTATIHPDAQISNFLGDPKAISIGANSHINGELLVLWDAGRISIGEWSHLGDGSRIWSHASVSIGNHVLISYLVNIHDTNGHPLEWQARRQDIQAIMSGKFGNRLPDKMNSEPVVIEDDAWIGSKATVFKGVRIGRGAIITPGAVVVKDVPAWTVVAGNPARVIQELPPSDAE